MPPYAGGSETWEYMTMIRHARRTRRRGLSTLEMVLSLPILLFIMALMINFGTVAGWKIRALGAARHAVWSSRWPRTSHNNPRPAYWPESAAFSAEAAGNVPELDDPRVDQPVARGPLSQGATVNEELLDPTRGLRRGTASIRRTFPMLGKMGTYHLEARTHLLDDKWQYARMSWPEQNYRLSYNVWRRIPVIYALARASESFAQDHVQAALAILYAPFRSQLDPLDRDDEFLYYSYIFGWGTGARDFHPRLSEFCTLDFAVANRRVQDLIDRIQGNRQRRVRCVAQRMTEAFLGLYRRVLREYPSLDTSNLSPADAAALAERVAGLEPKIQILEQFLASLRASNGT